MDRGDVSVDSLGQSTWKTSSQAFDEWIDRASEFELTAKLSEPHWLSSPIASFDEKSSRGIQLDSTRMATA
jgi:hypothetical protein